MKILSYNINKFTQEKLDKVLQHDADVFILPEVACVSKVQLPNGYGMVWTGDIDFKGLGIIWKTGIDADILEWFNSNHQYFQPLMIEDKLIIGAWPTMTDQNAPKKYPQIAMEALKSFAPYLKEHPTVIAGDMNCFKGQSGETKQYSMEAIFEFLKSMDYVSAYHSKTGEAFHAANIHVSQRDKHLSMRIYTQVPVPLTTLQGFKNIREILLAIRDFFEQHLILDADAIQHQITDSQRVEKPAAHRATSQFFSILDIVAILTTLFILNDETKHLFDSDTPFVESPN